MIVDEMRRGAKPKDACITVLKRIAKNTIEKRLLNRQGSAELRAELLLPEQQGRATPACRCADSTFAVCTENGAQTAQNRFALR